MKACRALICFARVYIPAIYVRPTKKVDDLLLICFAVHRC